jgi:hypothetical protein
MKFEVLISWFVMDWTYCIGVQPKGNPKSNWTMDFADHNVKSNEEIYLNTLYSNIFAMRTIPSNSNKIQGL